MTLKLVQPQFLKNKPTLATYILASALSLSGIAGCSSKADGSKADQTSDKQPTQVATVTVAPIAMRQMSTNLTAIGELTVRDEIAVATDLDGFRIAQVLVDEGDFVQQGQPLIRLDGTLLDAQASAQAASVKRAQAAFDAQRSSQIAQVQRAQMSFELQRVQAEQAKRELDRVQGLVSEGVVAEETAEQRALAARQSRFSANAARADVLLAESGSKTTEASAAEIAFVKAQMSELNARRSRLVLRAPTSGLVLTRSARVGDVVTLSSGSLFRLARGGLIELSAQLSEADLAKLKPGTSAKVSLPDGSILPGRVRLVAPLVDGQTKLGRVRIALPVNNALRPGGFGQAQFALPASALPSVPERGIIAESDGTSILVVGADKVARRMKVNVLNRNDGYAAIQANGSLDGLSVILSGTAFVMPGDKINPISVKQP